MKKYLYIFKSELMSSLQYIFNIFSGLIGYFLHIFIFIQLYSYLYQGEREIINGYTLNQMIWYIVITEVIWSILKGRQLCKKISNDVKNGNIAYNISKPYSYIGYIFSDHFGSMLIPFITYFISSLVIGYLLVGTLPNITIINILLVIISIILALAISIFLVMFIGLFSFYVEDSGPFYWVYSKVILVLGTLLPIEYFPGIMQTILKYSPVYVTCYGPAKLFVDFSYQNAVSIISAQILYLFISYGICAFIYKKGVRKLNVNGG